MSFEFRPILAQLSRNKTGALLIALQVAMTLAIVTNAIDLIGSRLDSASRSSGVVDEELVLTERPILNGSVDTESLVRRDLVALRALPGVVSASVSNQVPLGQSGWNTTVSPSRDAGSPSTSAGMFFDDGSLMETLGLRLIEGRRFSPDEVLWVDPNKEQPEMNEVIVSVDLARKLFPDRDHWVGQTFFQGPLDDGGGMRIVGVVERLITPWAQTSEEAYFSMLLPEVYLHPFNYYVVRVEPGQADAVRQTLSAALFDVEPDRVSQGVRSIVDLRQRRFRAEHAVAWLLIAVTGLLLVVTASGVVGMASLWVTLRRKQIGVRRALGATRADIVRYFITENLLITAFGLTLGAFGAYVLNGFLMQQFDMPRLSVLQVPLGCVAMLVLAQLAVLGPALRGAAIQPSVATRSV